MPALARHHDDALIVMGFLGLGKRDLRQLSLDLSAAGVGFLEFLSQFGCTLEIVLEQKIERKLCIAHAPCSIQARYKRKAQVGGAQNLARLPRRADKGGNAGARIGIELFDAGGNQSAVLAHQRHQIGYSAERCHVHKLEPQVRPAETPAHNLNHFKRNTSSRKDGAFAITAFRIDHRNALRH